MRMVSVRQTFGTLNVRIVAVLKYHEHDEDEGRYFFSLASNDSSTRNGKVLHLGTPFMPKEEADHLIRVATEGGLIHSRMHNYNPSKEAENDLVRRRQNGGRYSPEQTVKSRGFTSSWRREKAKERASLLQQCKKDGVKPPPTEKQIKKQKRNGIAGAMAAKSAAASAAKKLKKGTKETEEEDAQDRSDVMLRTAMLLAKQQMGPQNEGREPREGSADTRDHANEASDDGFDADAAAGDDGDDGDADEVEEMKPEEVEAMLRCKSASDLISLRRQMDVEIARREAAEREKKQELLAKPPPPPGFKRREPPPPMGFVPRAEQPKQQQVPPGFVRKSCGPIISQSTPVPDSSDAPVKAGAPSPETDYGKESKQDQETERKSARVRKREEDEERDEKERKRRKKRRNRKPQHVSQGSEWTVPERSNARLGQRPDYKDRIRTPLIYYVKKEEKKVESSSDEEEKNPYKKVLGRGPGRPKGSKNSVVRKRIDKKPRPTNWHNSYDSKRKARGSKKIPDRPSVGFPERSVETDGTDLTPGERVWALDIRLIWCLAHVLAVTDDAVRVHFHGWPKKFDENVDMGSGKLRKLGNYKGSTLCWPGPVLSKSSGSSADDPDGEESGNDMDEAPDDTILSKIPAVLAPGPVNEGVDYSNRGKLWDLNSSSGEEEEDDVEDEQEGEKDKTVVYVTATAVTDNEEEGEDEEVEVDAEEEGEEKEECPEQIQKRLHDDWTAQGPHNEGKQKDHDDGDNGSECDGPGGYTYKLPTFPKPVEYVETVADAAPPAPDCEQQSDAAIVANYAPAPVVEIAAAPVPVPNGLDVLIEAATSSSDEDVVVSSLAKKKS